MIDQGSDKYVILSTYHFKKSGPDVFGAVQSVFLTCPDLNLAFSCVCGRRDAAAVSWKTPIWTVSACWILRAGKHERKKWIDRYVAQPFDPLWDAPLYEVFVLGGKEDSIVYIKIHHALTDGTGGDSDRKLDTGRAARGRKKGSVYARAGGLFSIPGCGKSIF